MVRKTKKRKKKDRKEVKESNWGNYIDKKEGRERAQMERWKWKKRGKKICFEWKIKKKNIQGQRTENEQERKFYNVNKEKKDWEEVKVNILINRTKK